MLDEIERIIKLLDDCNWSDEAKTLRKFKEDYMRIASKLDQASPILDEYLRFRAIPPSRIDVSNLNKSAANFWATHKEAK